MSDAPLRVIECQGDPRLMGKAQGLACRDAIGARLARAGISLPGRRPASLRPFLAGPVLGEGPGREIVRHYPHLGERIQGLARGAGRSIDDMMQLFLRASDGSLAGDVLALAAPAAARAGGSALLARPLARASGTSSGTSDSAWIARHSRPEVGFPSVELTLPWLATAVAGVNAAGVAALVAPAAGSTASAKPSVLLLVQECLQRFDDVTGCIDWCLKRPLAGAGSIVVGDESGAVAAVEVAGEERRVVSPGTRVLVTGGAAEQHDGLRRSLEPGAMPDAVGAALGAGVVLLPGDRSLRVRLFADGPEESLHVDM